MISVCILAVNEADKIATAIESANAAPWCDEVVVFDSGSTDETVSIAKNLGATVRSEPWVSFSENRQKIIAAARNDWVFILDADEQISPQLAQEIGGLGDDAMATHAIFEMPRRNFLMGRHVKAWDPDRVARLVDRRRLRWPERAIHDRPEPTSGTVGQLASPLLHNQHSSDWGDYFDGERYEKRSDALAREMYDRGKRIGFFGLWLRPYAAFVKFYLFKGGFMQGAFGLLIAQKAAVSVQLKYAKLWHLQQTEGK